MKRPPLKVHREIAEAIKQTVKAWPSGAPEERLWGALADHTTRARFDGIMVALVEAGWVRRRVSADGSHNLFFPGPNYDVEWRKADDP